MLPAEALDGLQESRFGQIESGICGNRLENDTGDLGAFFPEDGLQCLGIIEGDGRGEGGERCRNAGAVGMTEGEGTASGLDQQGVDMAVVASLELHDAVASRDTAGKADGRHDGLGAAIGHPDLLDGGNQAADGLGHLDFEGIRNAEAGTVLGRPGDGIDHDLRRMAQDSRSPGADAVDVFPAINIGDRASLGLVDEEGLTSDAAEGPHGGVHSADEALLGTLPEGVGEGRRL